MRTQLTHAWCKERNEVVSIDQAHLAATQTVPPLRFTFTCSDEQCRALYAPVVIGALYRVDVKEHEKKRARYFRCKSDSPHRPGCPMVTSLAKRDLPSRARTTDPTKLTNNIDHFSPKNGDGPPPRGARPPRSAEVKDDQTSDGKPRQSDGSTSEYRLSRLLAVRKRLKDEGKLKETYVLLNNLRLSYASAFLAPDWLKQSEARSLRIVLGMARCMQTRDGSAFVLYFLRHLERFPSHLRMRDLRVLLPRARLQASARGLALLATLEQLHEHRRRFEFAALGDIAPNEKGGYVLHVSSLFSVEVQPGSDSRGSSTQEAIKLARQRA